MTECLPEPIARPRQSAPATYEREVVTLLTEIRDAIRQPTAAPQPQPGEASDVVKHVASELEAAAIALDVAARQLLNITNMGGHAKQAHLAAQRARKAGQELLGDE